MSSPRHVGGIEVRLATSDDLDAIKEVCDQHRNELGFIARPALIYACERRALWVARVGANGDGRTDVAGFTQVHFRRDGQTTLHTIAVRQGERRHGIGREMVNAVVSASRERGMHTVLLRCPVELEANHFYEHVGFWRTGMEPGKHRPLSVWAYTLGTDGDTDDAGNSSH